MLAESLARRSDQPDPTRPSLVGFTASGTWVVPAGCTRISGVLVAGGETGALVGGGASGTFTGGRGGMVLPFDLDVVPGETLTVTVGSTAQPSSISGSFGTRIASGFGAAPSADGTYVPGWGWYGGGGGSAINYDSSQTTIGKPGGFGGGGFGLTRRDNYGSALYPPTPNSGGGSGAGGWGYSNYPGAAGFVGIQAR